MWSSSRSSRSKGTFALVGALSFLSAAGAEPPARGPFIPDASSTTARVCWRPEAGIEGYSCRDHTGLLPGATFSYTIPGSGLHWTGKTLPPRGHRLRFAALGDSGSGDAQQERVAALLEKLEPDMVLLLGDIVYPSGRDDDYGPRYFAPYAKSLRRIPFFPAVGNHDYGNMYVLPWPGERRYRKAYHAVHGRPKYYSFDAGDAHFISLDTCRSHRIPAAASLKPGSDQWRWLEADLAASSAPWKFVFLHVGVYSSGKHGSHEDLRKALEPLFIRYGVDVVFQGHDHFYERTQPIRGVVYVTAGNGGAPLHYKKTPQSWSARTLYDHGLVMATLEGPRLLLEMAGPDGVLDSARIEKPSSR